MKGNGQKYLETILSYSLAALLVVLLFLALLSSTDNLSWSLEWPSTLQAWSETFRNVGLIVVGIIGVVVALWRGSQTDRQLELTSKQLSETQSQFATLQKNTRFQQEQATFQEASKLLSDDDPAISNAGLALMQRLESKGSFQLEARDTLDTFGANRPFLTGFNLRDRRLLQRTLARNDDVTLYNTYLMNVIIDGADTNIYGTEINVENCNVHSIGFLPDFPAGAARPKWNFRNCYIKGDVSAILPSATFVGCIIFSNKTLSFSSGRLNRCIRYYSGPPPPRQAYKLPSSISRLSDTSAPVLKNEIWLNELSHPGGAASVRAWGSMPVPEHTDEASLELFAGPIGVADSVVARLTDTQKAAVGFDLSKDA